VTEPTLTLTARPGGQSPIPTDSGLEVTAEWEWLLRGPVDHVAAAHKALPGVSDLIAEGVLLISFGNAVGLVDIPHLGRVNVVSGKWHEQHYQQMLADVTAIAAGLPFSANSATALPYDRSVVAHEDVLYHMFTYLRHILSEQASPEQQLLPALRQILHDPHQRFRTSRTMVPLAAAQHIDATSLLQIAAGVGGMVKAPTTLRAASQLAHVLDGQLPEYVDERRVEHSVDTLENRFVKMALGTATAIIERMQQTLSTARRPAAFTARVLQDCDRMLRALRPITQHSIWRQIGPLNQLPTTSTVLQGRRGYREVYGHYIRLRLATQVPLSAAQVRSLLESKDIALLYEIWCFFALVRALTAMLGSPEVADRPRAGALELHIPWDLAVRWGNGVCLFYNPRFSRSRSLGRRSYSVPLRPDIALELPIPQGKILHLFDAKFKVDRLDTLLPSEEEMDETSGDDAIAERRGIFKRGDIYKMHTYRDAIPAARTVWILYPGTESRFFHRHSGPATIFPGQALPDDLDGVGAIALRPDDGDHTSLRDVLACLLGATLHNSQHTSACAG
jgi:uncharacterized protein